MTEPASAPARHDRLSRVHAPARRVVVQFVVITLAVAGLCWFFGADVWHASLIGTAAALVAATLYGPVGESLRTADWRGGDVDNREGSRRDVAELASSLRGRYGRVRPTAVIRVQRIARHRLALHQLDPTDPTDQPEIEQLIGSSAFEILVHKPSRQPSRRALLHSLDVLDSLSPTRPTTSPSRSRPHADPGSTALEESP